MATATGTGKLYVDRSQVLCNAGKLPNIHRDCVAIPCLRSKLDSLERRFSYKLEVQSNELFLDALVLENDVCVLVLKTSMRLRLSSFAFNVTFSDGVHCDDISGKHKKGAQLVAAGSVALPM